MITAIVGAGRNLGAALARRFGQDGPVALLARNATGLAELEAELRALGLDARGFPADAGDAGSLRSALVQVRERIGDPDVLVYNALDPAPARPTELDPEALVDAFRVNVVGALVAASAVTSTMRQAGQGTILLTGGGLAVAPTAELAALSIGKAGLRSLAHALAEELAPDGIHVATVTIMGTIRPGGPFDPDAIAEAFHVLHAQPRDGWEIERAYRG